MPSSVVILDSIQLVGLLFLAGYIWWFGAKKPLNKAPGWPYIQSGFALILFGSLLDFSDNFNSLRIYVVIGDTPTKAFLETIVGYLGGFLLLTIGLIRSQPTAEQNGPFKTPDKGEQAQQLLLDAIEGFEDGFALFDADDRLLLYNSQFAKTADEVAPGSLVIGKTFEQLARGWLAADVYKVPENKREGFLHERVARHQDTPSHHTHQHADGVWVQVIETRTADGGIVLVQRNITDHVEREQALAESEQLFRDFAESTSDYFWEQDEQFRFTKFIKESKNRTEFDRYRESKSMGRTRWQVAEANFDEDEQWRQHVDDCNAHRNFRNFRHQLADEDGKMHVMSVNGKPIFDSAGVFKGYRGTTTDVTDLVQTQTKNERFTSALYNLPEGLALWNAEGRLEFANEHFGKLIGPVRSKLVPGISYEEWLRACVEAGVSPEAQGCEEDWVAERLADFQKLSGAYEVKRGGRWQLFRFQQLSDGGTMQLNVDIDDLKLSEEKLRQAQRMEAVGQLTGGVAHDFNNLLGIMIGNTELLEDRVFDDEEAMQNIEAVIKAVNRGKSLTQRLLAFSRQQTLSSRPTNINDQISGLGEMLQRTLGEMTELKLQLGSKIFSAEIDPHQFENALINLAINARDAMENGGSLTIETANADLDQAYAAGYDEVTPGDYVKVSVTDTGTGMTPEVQKNVFEPFFTTKDVGKGSGLGLSMVYGFIKQSTGHIAIDSELGKGTTIELYLPRSKVDAAEKAVSQKTRPFELKSMHVLVVEDDAELREISTRIFRALGCQVAEAKDGREAIAQLKKSSGFDLLFSDVVLPGGINGVDIAEQARQMHPDIKVLFATGYAEGTVIHRSAVEPGIAVINKPYDRAELLEKVQASFDGTNDLQTRH